MKPLGLCSRYAPALRSGWIVDHDERYVHVPAKHPRTRAHEECRDHRPDCDDASLDDDASPSTCLDATSNGGVTILRGVGDGSFLAGVTVHSVTGMRDTYVEDIGGDDIDDIVATRTASGDGSIRVILSNP